MPVAGVSGVYGSPPFSGVEGMSMSTLDQILSNEEPETVEVVEQPRDESGKFVSKGEPEAAESESPAPIEQVKAEPLKEQELDHPALLGERRRRQEAEARIAELEAKANPPAPPPSVFEDEQGFGSHIVSTAVQQASFNAKLDMSEMMVRQANPDFEDMKATFIELAKANPGIAETALADPHPWNKAYQIAKTHKAMQEVSATSVDELKAKLREEIVAEMAAKANPAPQIPVSLADAQSARTQSDAPPRRLSLDEILAR